MLFAVGVGIVDDRSVVVVVLIVVVVAVVVWSWVRERERRVRERREQTSCHVAIPGTASSSFG